MKINILFLIVMVAMMLQPTISSAQRLQHLGRGVVATYNGSSVFVSWRRLVQDPENATYNVYVAKSGDDYTKITSTPTKLTSMTTNMTVVPQGSKVSVTMIDKDGNESALSTPFTFNKVSIKGTFIKDAYLAVNYDEAGSPLKGNGRSYTTKFCWPVDLDGDGEMDYVVDRVGQGRDMNGYVGEYGDCLEAYSSKGKHLWTVELGPNIWLSQGQNDCVTVGDFDGDGKGEVVVEASDGTRLWNKAAGTWGKYLAYGANTGDNPDTEGDGIVNYTSYQAGLNPQYYMMVINGETGEQKAVVPMTLPKDNDMEYTRKNKAAFNKDEYPWMMGAMGTAYLDGVHPSAVIQFQVRTSNGTHHYFTYAYGYFNDGAQTVAGEWHEKWIFKFHDYKDLSEFHHIRIGDVDGDGKDEIMNGQCAVDDDGTLLWTSHISHGDRFRMSDIDPDRPGQEIFAIQQNAPDMLGMILYDAADGQAIKKWYLSSVGDVGRGECMDVDKNHKGYEMWSTMPNMYDAHGDMTGTSKPYPTEGVWWDADLGREVLFTSGSGNNCPAIIGKWNGGEGYTILYEVSKNSSWFLPAENAVRPMFWGDIYGDWREEIILKQLVDGVECGFCCLTTDNATTVDNIYCLLQDPAYYGQITNRGYYQSPNTSFYLGWDMPRPQLPPYIQADEDNAVFGLTLGNTTVQPSATAKNQYFMPVKGQTLTIDKDCEVKETLWKSQMGTLVVNGKVTGNVVLSQGEMQINGSIDGIVDVRARGVLKGNGTVKRIVVEGSLNHAEGVIHPTGTLTVGEDLTFANAMYVELSVRNNDMLSVKGNLTLNADVTFIIDDTELKEGVYNLIEYGGEFSGIGKFLVRGLTGMSYNIENKDGKVTLNINGQREAANSVVWTGAKGNVWDYQTENWTLDGLSTGFVAGDGIVFNDDAQQTTITVDALMPIGSATFNNNTKNITVAGNGGFSGTGDVMVNGTGRVILNATKSDYTGKTVINSGTVTVKELADAGLPSSIGAASADASNLQIGKATLVINNTNTATNRGMTLNDEATIQIGSGTVAFKGIVKGAGQLRKTGAGQVNITYAGANSWSGTILEAGTLAMGAWNTTFGSMLSPIHVTGNSTITMFDNKSSSTMPNVQNAITIDKGKTLTFHAGSRCKVSGSLSGEGTFKIDFPYVRGDVYTNTSKFEGIYEVASDNCRFVQAMDLSKATLKLNEGAYAAGFSAGSGNEAVYNHKVGTLTGTGTLGSGTWQVSRLLVNYNVGIITTSCDAVTVNGTVRFNNLAIDMNPMSSLDIPDNAVLTVIKGIGSRTVTGTVTISPEKPKEGWMWDTSMLASDGTIRVVPDVSAISAIDVDMHDLRPMYDLQGRKVKRPAKGVYIKGGKKVLITE